MKLSEYIKLYRVLDVLSLRQFADKCGLSFQYVSNLENEKVKSPSMDAMKKIAKGTGVSLQELLVLTEYIEPDFKEEQLKRLELYSRALNALKRKDEELKNASLQG